MATITEQLGEFAANISLARLPDEVIEKANACFLWGLRGAFTTDESYADNEEERQMAGAIAVANLVRLVRVKSATEGDLQTQHSWRKS